MRFKSPVIANQSADWCGNPPVRKEMYRKVPWNVSLTAIFGGNRYLVRFNRGIATPVCALVRNDSIYSANTNLSLCLPDRGAAVRGAQPLFSFTTTTLK